MSGEACQCWERLSCLDADQLLSGESSKLDVCVTERYVRLVSVQPVLVLVFFTRRQQISTPSSGTSTQMLFAITF